MAWLVNPVSFRSRLSALSLLACDPVPRMNGLWPLSRPLPRTLLTIVLQPRALAMASFSPFSSRTPGMIAEPMTKDGVPAKLKARA